MIITILLRDLYEPSLSTGYFFLLQRPVPPLNGMVFPFVDQRVGSGVVVEVVVRCSTM